MGWGHFPTPEKTARNAEFNIAYSTMFRAAYHARHNGYSFGSINPNPNFTHNKPNTPPTEHTSKQMISRYEQSGIVD